MSYSTGMKVIETTKSGTTTERQVRDAGHAQRMQERIKSARPDSKTEIKK